MVPGDHTNADVASVADGNADFDVSAKLVAPAKYRVDDLDLSRDNSTSPTGIHRKAMKILMCDGLIVLCVLLLVELALQRWAPDYAQHLFDAEYTGGHPVQINSHGFRGPEVALAKAEGEFRILALGDSVTFGTGVAAEETWSAQLAGMLGQIHAGEVVAINTGLPAIDLRQMRMCLLEDWSSYSPDVVVLALTGNMVSLSLIRQDLPVEMPHNGFLACGESGSMLDSLKTQTRRGIKQLALPSFLSMNSQRVLYKIGLLHHDVDPDAPYGVLLAHGWRQRDLCATRAEDAWVAFADDLAALRDAVESVGASLIVTYAPPRFTLSQAWGDNEKSVPLDRLTIEPWARAAAICRELAIPYVDAHALLQAEAAGGGQPLYVQFDYTHFSTNGHRVIAEAVARRVAEQIGMKAPEP